MKKPFSGWMRALFWPLETARPCSAWASAHKQIASLVELLERRLMREVHIDLHVLPKDTTVVDWPRATK